MRPSNASRMLSVDASPAKTRASRFGFFPGDERQALRIRRLLMAAASSLLVVIILFAFARVGTLPVVVAQTAAIGIAALVVFFYVALRSGLNLLSSDPSLTAEQMGAAILLLACVMYGAPQSRGALVILYVMPLMFGVLRLRTPRLLVLAALALFAHAVVVCLSVRDDPTFNVTAGLTQLALLAVILPWFAVMGGYVNQLRRRLSDTNRSLTGAYDRIAELSIRDPLTGVFNRRRLLESIAEEQGRSARLHSPLALCMFDVDNFKSVNDTFGHSTGDEVLKYFATLAGTGLRANDVLGRFGGEEFLLVLPGADSDAGFVVAERIRMRVAAASFPGLPSDRRVTVTIGLAVRKPAETAAQFIERADAAMYVGKEAGRDRVMLAG